MEEEKYLKRQRIYKTIMLVVLTVFVTIILTTVYLVNNYEFGIKEDSSILLPIINNISETENNELYKQLKNIDKVLEQYYLYDIDEQKAIEGAIAGYVGALEDEYTEYIPISEMEDYTQEVLGNYVGIGIYMIKNSEKNTVDVLVPIKDTPAEKAGILPGDSIIKINDKEYTGDDMTAAANAIKGEEGTRVKLEILRGEETLTFEVTREKITINPVISKKLENNIGYLEITSFDEGTSDSFKTKYEELKSQGIKSLIIDLRNNGGGIVNEALDIADYIVPKGNSLLITVDKNGKKEVKKAENEVIIDIPVVVLVNENTASASEILAGALKENNVATLIGTKTYGKGVIQQILTLPSGAGLKLTVEEYYTPNNTKIHKVGIEPNEIVELPEEVENPVLVTDKQDTQLKRAIEILK